MPELHSSSEDSSEDVDSVEESSETTESEESKEDKDELQAKDSDSSRTEDQVSSQGEEDQNFIVAKKKPLRHRSRAAPFWGEVLPGWRARAKEIVLVYMRNRTDRLFHNGIQHQTM